MLEVSVGLGDHALVPSPDPAQLNPRLVPVLVPPPRTYPDWHVVVIAVPVVPDKVPPDNTPLEKVCVVHVAAEIKF